MAKLIFSNPFDQLYHLTKQREKIALKADQLSEMIKPFALEHGEGYSLIITNTGARIASKHIKSIQKILKTLNKSYQKRLAKKEAQIKQHIQDHLNPPDNGNQE